MKTYVIYLPGLGNGYDPLRRLCLKIWRLYGVSVELVPLNWTDGESFVTKYETVQRAIDRLPDRRIVLIGESAGATMALYVGAREKTINHVITLCGVTSNDVVLAPHLHRRSPALVAGIDNLDGRNGGQVTSLRAWWDPVVGRHYSVAPDADERVIWSIGHFLTVALCLTLYGPWVAHLIRKT